LKYAPQRLGNYFQNHTAKQYSVMDNELCMNHSKYDPWNSKSTHPLRKPISACVYGMN